MRKRILPVVLTVFLAGMFTLPTARAQQPPPQPAIAHTSLKVGDMAPDFTLRSDQNATVKLSDYRGKKDVILAFYVLAFTGG
jgi:cytochrome oxidase Cu insertion factor (SCO1/SenC/PrrC family)